MIEKIFNYMMLALSLTTVTGLCVHGLHLGYAQSGMSKNDYSKVVGALPQKSSDSSHIHVHRTRAHSVVDNRILGHNSSRTSDEKRRFMSKRVSGLGVGDLVSLPIT
jgi:hypothetical protein